MTCTSCIARITKAVRKLDGVAAVRVDLGSDTATVAFDPSRTSLASIGRAIDEAGYEALVDRAGPVVPAVRGGVLNGLRRRLRR